MLDVLFINSTESLSIREESNGTMLLATKLLQAGYSAEILRFCQIEYYKENYSAFIHAFISRIISYKPKCVSFYTLWPYYHIMLRIAKEIKLIEPNIVTILGGPQATLTAMETMHSMDYIDYICTGEGENTIVPFMNEILNENRKNLTSIPGLLYRENGTIIVNNINSPLANLDSLPHWEDRLYKDTYVEQKEQLQSANYYMPIDAGRGCPFNCTFCCTSLFLHRSFRLKSAEKIIEDIEYYMSKFGIRSFSFAHDAFTTNKKLIEEVCDLIIQKKLDIIWKCTSRIDLISTELILKMKKAGLRIIELGIETGSQRMQKIINKRLDLDKARRMIEFLRQNKIKITLFFMYGFPEETEEDLNQTLEFYFSMIDAGLNQASMAYCRFYPTTKMTTDYYDSLILDPINKKASRGIFGYAEEIDLISNHKHIFPFYYHLNTEIRNKYQFIYFLAHIYEVLPNSIKHLRKLYKGNNIQFFLDFEKANKHIFEKDITHITNISRNDPLQMLRNHINTLDISFKKQLIGLMRFDYNFQTMQKTADEYESQEIYDFDYIDFKLKLPIESYSCRKTEIQLKKHNGTPEMKILRFI